MVMLSWVCQWMVANAKYTSQSLYHKFLINTIGLETASIKQTKKDQRQFAHLSGFTSVASNSAGNERAHMHPF